MMLDGQGKLKEALNEFVSVKEKAPSDSYYAMDASYEVARLSLALWLNARTQENYRYLEQAESDFEFWLARDWNKLTMKLWGYYHAVCVYREKLKWLTELGLQPTQQDRKRLAEYTKEFQSAARSQRGVRKYELRFTAFFLTGSAYERFPGEPLRCGLNDLLAEFKIF